MSRTRSFWSGEHSEQAGTVFVPHQLPPPGPWQEFGRGPLRAETPGQVPELFLERGSRTFLCTEDGRDAGTLWKQLEMLMGWAKRCVTGRFWSSQNPEEMAGD